VWRPWQLALRIARSGREPPSGFRRLRVAWGARLLADPGKAIGRSIWTTGVHDLAVTETFARLIRPGDTVVDAGANIGYMALLAARAAGPKGKVYAFEPYPRVIEVLRENVLQGNTSCPSAEIIIREEALGAKTGTVRLAIPEGIRDNDGLAYVLSNGDAGDDAVEVAITTIDEVFPSDVIDMMKIDVEGYELEVLKGMRRTLASGRLRHILFEDHEEARGEVARQLELAGYTILAIGWTVAGPVLSPIGGTRRAKRYESPSYVATRDPQEVHRLSVGRGWITLRHFCSKSKGAIRTAGTFLLSMSFPMNISTSSKSTGTTARRASRKVAKSSRRAGFC
jgi:FkbM family methyltransferase